MWQRYRRRPRPEPEMDIFLPDNGYCRGESSRSDFLARELLRQLRYEMHKNKEKDKEKDKKKDDKKDDNSENAKNLLAIAGLLLLAGPFVSKLYEMLLKALN